MDNQHKNLAPVTIAAGMALDFVTQLETWTVFVEWMKTVHVSTEEPGCPICENDTESLYEGFKFASKILTTMADVAVKDNS